MGKKNKKRKLACAVYLSVEAEDWEMKEKEEKQYRYVKDFCKGNHIKIVKVYHRAGLSFYEVQRHFAELARQVAAGEIEGVVIANSQYVSMGVLDLYYKVGRIVQAGGRVYSVDEGLLELPLKM